MAGGAGGGGGGRHNPSRNRKSKKQRARKRDNSRRNGGGGNRGGGNNGNNKRNKGPPSPPQTKIVVRNIGDVTKHGSAKEVIELIRSIIQGANQKLAATTSRIIQLDETSVECLIQEEEAVLKAKQEEEEAKKKEEEQKAEESAGHDNNEAKETEGDVEADANPQPETTPAAEEEKPSTIEKPSSNPREKSDASMPSATEPSTTNLGARLVYVVPPKQTRRRGIKPGCAYLVISGPSIEAKDPVVTPAPVEPAPSDSAKEEKKESVEEQEQPAAESEQQTGNPDDDDKAHETAPSPEEDKAEHHVTIAEPASATIPAPPVPTVDYSREVAQGRFLVIQAIDVMEAHAKEDTKADQNYAGSMVEVAMSGKTYKHQFHRRDRREGTLETTADYKTFIENAAKAKEEIMARPKPTPGGGVAAMAATSTDAAENGMPIAALVDHIRSKRAEASKRKKAKKKAKEASNKEKGGGGKSSRKKKGKEGAKEEGGKKGGRKKDGKRRKSGKKKNGKGGANNSIPPGGPTAVLKPGGAGGGGAPGSGPVPQQPAAASLPGINGVMGGFQGYG